MPRTSCKKSFCVWQSTEQETLRMEKRGSRALLGEHPWIDFAAEENTTRKSSTSESMCHFLGRAARSARRFRARHSLCSTGSLLRSQEKNEKLCCSLRSRSSAARKLQGS